MGPAKKSSGIHKNAIILLTPLPISNSLLIEMMYNPQNEIPKGINHSEQRN